MIIPAVYVFMGRDGMSAGPGLMFISLPKVFNEMGIAGDIVGLIFFMIVALQQSHRLYQLWRLLYRVL